MRSTSILLALGLAACGSGGGPPSPPNPSLSLSPALWTIGPIIDGKSDSPRMPLHPNADGVTWGIDFPATDGVHYITTSKPGSMSGTMTATFTVSGAGKLVCPASGGTSPPKARLYFQRVGDNWSTNGYRWWSNAYTVLLDGTYTMAVPLTYADWGSIYGQTGLTVADFQTALAHVDNVGITFGCDFAGHGIYASPQPVHFTMNSFKVQ